MTQRSPLSVAWGALLPVASLFASCTTDAPNDDVAWQLRATHRYADSLGIDTLRYAAAAAEDTPTVTRKTLDKLITEINYGHTPTDQSFAKLPETVDSAVVGKIARAADVVAALKANTGTFFGPYRVLLTQYNRVRKTASATQVHDIEQTLNFYRYLNRFSGEKLIVVNIPAARLTIFDRNGKRELPMDVIVGKADKATPRFNCYLTEVVVYPYWNVPEGIGLNEILPKVQVNPGYLDSQNMDVLDRHDKPVDPESVDWANVSVSHFPYRFRQTSGCHNALGLIKFVLNGPPAIYFHDTNARQLFNQTTNHWRSHGCVRVEKPIELANLVLGEPKFDQDFYNRCLTDQSPKPFKLPKPFPVFVTYNLADVDDQGKLVYYKDVYGRKGSK